MSQKCMIINRFLHDMHFCFAINLHTRCCRSRMVCSHKMLNCLNSTDFWEKINKNNFKKILSLLFNFDISGFESEAYMYELGLIKECLMKREY